MESRQGEPNILRLDSKQTSILRSESSRDIQLSRSASTDKLLALKSRAERAAGKLEVEDEVESSFRAALIEIALYVVFVIIFGVVTWLSANEVGYPYSSKIDAVITGGPPRSFYQVHTEPQFWDFLETTFVPAVFVNSDQNGDRLPPERLGYLMDVHKILGAVRFEQKRVKRQISSCAIPPVYASLIDNCYSRIRSELDVSDLAYGPEGQFVPTSTGFFVNVGGQRFVQDLASDLDPNLAIAKLEQLRNQSWIDRQTRQVNVVMTVYNPAVDLFCVVSLQFDFLHTGGIRTSSTYRTVSMLRQWLLLTPTRIFFPPSLKHKVAFAVEVTFLLIIIALVVAEVRQLARIGWWAYISSVWNGIDVINLSLFIVFFFFRFLFIALTSAIDFRPSPSTFSEFRYMGELTFQSLNLTAFNCILTYLKMFKYLQFSTRLSQLTRTITEAADDLVGFLFMFLLIFMAYAFSFHMAFGMDIANFSDFLNAFYSLFLIILGDFDFTALRLANDLLGPLLFISYVVIVYLILFNMFLAIIGEAYVRVKDRTSASEDPFMRNLRAGLNARKQRRLRKLESSLGGELNTHVTAADIREIEFELREILGDSEAEQIMLKVALEDETGAGLPQDELAKLMARIVESREKLEAETKQQEAIEVHRLIPPEIEARDPAFALRVSQAKVAREKIEQIELNQKNLFDSVQSSQKAVLLKLHSLTNTMETIGAKLAVFKPIQRR